MKNKRLNGFLIFNFFTNKIDKSRKDNIKEQNIISHGHFNL